MKDRWQRQRWVYRDKRWPALRLAALRRDGWKCVKCGSKRRLQVDHIQPIRKRPELAFTLGNLQTLCGSCHTTKTRRELGFPELPPARKAWMTAIKHMQKRT